VKQTNNNRKAKKKRKGNQKKRTRKRDGLWLIVFQRGYIDRSYKVEV
jgi:hypothetical protein